METTRTTPKLVCQKVKTWFLLQITILVNLKFHIFW